MQRAEILQIRRKLHLIRRIRFGQSRVVQPPAPYRNFPGYQLVGIQGIMQDDPQISGVHAGQAAGGSFDHGAGITAVGIGCIAQAEIMDAVRAGQYLEAVHKPGAVRLGPNVDLPNLVHILQIKGDRSVFPLGSCSG
ncbi:hypothetical protein D3C75_1078020 [compost metagenome]